MAAYRGPRRGAPGRRGATGRAGTRRGDQGSASTNRTGADHSATERPGAGRSATGRSTTGRSGAGRGNTGRGADLPRRTAYDVLAAVEARQSYANLLLPRLLAERGITGRDAALATELSYGTLRGLGTYDAVLAACSDRPWTSWTRRCCRSSGSARTSSWRPGSPPTPPWRPRSTWPGPWPGPRVSGYVNAVLRRVATRDLDAWLPLVAPDPAADAEGYLAVRYSYPRWIVAAYRDALGPAADTELAAALAAGNDRPRVTMAAFPGGPPREAIMPEGAEPTRWSPYGFTLAGGDPSSLVADGVAAVQDEASQLAAIALATAPLDGPDRLWLDMCAGPGGKARLLYGLAEEAGARLVAADLHEHRAALVRDALARTPHHGSGTTVITADGRRPPGPTPRSTGCCSTSPAPASAPSAAARKPAGARQNPTCRPSPSCSAPCCALPWRPAVPGEWSPT